MIIIKIILSVLCFKLDNFIISIVVFVTWIVPTDFNVEIWFGVFRFAKVIDAMKWLKHVTCIYSGDTGIGEIVRASYIYTIKISCNIIH